MKGSGRRWKKPWPKDRIKKEVKVHSLFSFLDFFPEKRKMNIDLLGELDRLRDSGKKSGMTPRTCWIIPAEGSKFKRVPSRRFFLESTAFLL